MTNLKALDLFHLLFSQYGPQYWWPGEGFEICIGAILTQNTSWGNVEIALENLRKKSLLDPQKILDCSISELKELIKPSGFFNQKAIYLRNISALWLKNKNPTRDELLSVKGIGDETADSILLYLFNKPEFIIDAYTIRISNRLGFGDSQNRKFWKKFYQKNLPSASKLFNEFHALIVLHCKKICTKRNPKCNDCFLKPNCNSSKSFIQD